MTRILKWQDGWVKIHFIFSTLLLCSSNKMQSAGRQQFQGELLERRTEDCYSHHYEILLLSKTMWSEMWWGCSLFIYFFTCHGILKAFILHQMIVLAQLTAKFWLQSLCIALAPRDISWDQDHMYIQCYSDRQGLSDELMVYFSRRCKNMFWFYFLRWGYS